MITGPIQNIDSQFTIDRHEEQLPHAWVNWSMRREPRPTGALLRKKNGDSASTAPAPSNDNNAPVLVMLHQNSQDALALLLDYAHARRRIYVLAPSDWRPVALDRLDAPKILIRRAAELPVTGFQIGDWTRLWLGADRDEEPEWSLRLDKAQAADFRQLFLRIFWHEAVNETWMQNGHMAFGTVAERPFDVPLLSSNSQLRRVPASESLDLSDAWTAVHVPLGPLPEHRVSQLWTKPSALRQNELTALAAADTAIGWADTGLPDLAVDERGGVALLPANGARRLRLQLTPAQAAELIDFLAQKTPWTFEQQIQLGAMASMDTMLWLPNTDAPARVQAEQVIAIPQLKSPTLRETPHVEPETLPFPAPLTLSARYQWSVMPPLAPITANEDALIDRWRSLDNAWRDALAATKTALGAAEKKHSYLGKNFVGLLRALMGFTRKYDELKKERDQLAAQKPSEQGPAEANKLLKRLTLLEQNVRKLQSDLSESERKELEKRERERQEAEWRAKIEAARHDLSKCRERIEEANKRRPPLEEKQTKLKNELDELKDALEKRKAATAEAGKGEKSGKGGKGGKDGKKAPKNNRIKSLNATQNKVSKQLRDIDREVNRANDEIAAHERTLKAPFVFKPSTAPAARDRSAKKGRFIPATSATRPVRQIPEEALPEVGALLSHQGSRFLAISSWQELSAGETSATRLNAQLVGKRRLG